jgi:hypothetical protein
METAASIWLILIGLYGMFRWKPIFGESVLPEVATRVASSLCLIVGTLNLLS